MKRKLVITGLLAAAVANAGYSGSKLIDRIWTDNAGNAYFGVFGAIDAGLCNPGNNAGQYAFNATTPSGKNYYATLLIAKSSGLKIDIWWEGGMPSGTACNNWGWVSGLGISQSQ